MSLPTTPQGAPDRASPEPLSAEAPVKPALERFLRIAARLVNAPIAMIHSVQPFFVVSIGLQSHQSAVENHDIVQSAALELILDVRADSRLLGVPDVEFYIGVPLSAADGSRLGTLCVIDQRARLSLDALDLAALEDVAASVAAELERCREAARLEQQRDFYDTVTQSAEFIAIITDAQGRVTRLNPCAERTLGIGASEAQGRRIWALFSDLRAAALVERAMRRVLRGTASLSKTLSLSGELSWISELGAVQRHAALSCVTMCDSSGAIRHVIISGIDISALRNSELAARRAAQTTAQTLSARGDFLNYVTHELRTPLHAISGYCDLLLDPGLGALNPDQSDFANEIRSAADHLFALISDLLDLSKINAGSVDFAPKQLNPTPLLRGCLSMLKTAAQQGGVLLSLEVDSGSPAMYGEERSIRQVLVNLLSNAVKFTPSGGHVRLSLTTDGDWQRLAVRDTGIGLLEEDLARIFEPFTQARNSPAHHRSFGLGLTLSRKLAELHGGWIEVTSQLGAGSTFTLVLPREPSARTISEFTHSL